MLPLVIAYVVTVVVFLAVDFVGLSYIVKPTFERYISDWLLEDLRLGPALAFYLFFVIGVIWFVSAPAIFNDKTLVWVFLNAAFLGALAYGTYEFTNLATLRDWSWTMVATDLTWGTFLTGFSATVGVAVTRALT
ncbi:DUF2177 family protein [Litoreibacter roseus]|uniref:DUF2177 family protein n=1 Tax=Litoreibacter roseus TaxID=2601869 RepID=A0A6N6JNI2_9RHOB|nr:DUF2177 family protein [Litoreibacter roseus]GFE66902.1 hypothetical protein KIN_39760 [Litoreibacter roseus]